MAEEAKGVSKWVWWCLLLVPIIFLVIGMGGFSKKSPSHSYSNSKGQEGYPYEYKLSVGEKVYTKVKVGQGTNLQLWASKPFYVVTDQLVQLADGTTRRDPREYWMPDGESSWTGGDPVGLFTLRGETDGTIVRIKVL